MSNSIRFPRILNALQSRAWAIQVPFLQSIATTLYNANHGMLVAPPAGAAAEPLSIPQRDAADGPVQNSIAIINIHGVIGRHLSGMEMECGGCCLDVVEQELALAVEDPSVDAIILHIDSPGGVTDGIDAAALAVSAAAEEKPVYAFTDSMMCSAAYWLACGATQIYSTPLADVGSIGVYMAWVDQSKFMEKEGLELKIFKAGRMKGMHLPGQMTEECEEHLQSQIDEIYAAFTGKVLQHRSITSEEMQGQSFLGSKAAALGLVDDTVASFSELLAAVAYNLTTNP